MWEMVNYAEPEKKQILRLIKKTCIMITQPIIFIQNGVF